MLGITCNKLGHLYVFYSTVYRSNPNEHHRPDTGTLPASKERNRFKGIVWDEYDAVHQKYLEIGRWTLLSQPLMPG